MVEMRALIDSNRYFDRVENYYSQFSFDLTASNENILIPPRKIDRISTRSIIHLLNALKRFGERGEKNFLIATHGNPNGLPIRIRQNNPVTLNADIIQDMCLALADDANARTGLLNMTSPSGQQVFQNAGQLDEILNVVRQIRRFRFETLEFRGCNIGAGPALAAVGTSCSAPG